MLNLPVISLLYFVERKRPTVKMCISYSGPHPRSHPIRKIPGGSHEPIKATLSGIRYLETYHRTLIRTIVPFAYIGWIAYSAVFILMPSQSLLWIPLSYILTAVGFCGLFAIQRLPWTLHIHILFPMFFLQDVTRKFYLHSSVFRGRKLDAKVDRGYPFRAGSDCSCVAECDCTSFRLSTSDWLYS
jgi:Phosphatidylinositolglycan class N (PIG-N)